MMGVSMRKSSLSPVFFPALISLIASPLTVCAEWRFRDRMDVLTGNLGSYLSKRRSFTKRCICTELHWVHIDTTSYDHVLIVEYLKGKKALQNIHLLSRTNPHQAF